ncbi:hypothetical protein [Breoghania corrubedonensis]|uniref:hypothetical protein n=1 Tax=Breoghania corrubedonensis TaxID=665038 RepID=UPI0011B262EE|nr:hypothetical protein [Breoghania corrubedonensis]
MVSMSGFLDDLPDAHSYRVIGERVVGPHGEDHRQGGAEDVRDQRRRFPPGAADDPAAESGG